VSERRLEFAADLSALDRKYRAKRSAQSPAEYAVAIERYRRPSLTAARIAYTAALLALAAIAIYLGAA
jgi:hypothetical protein